MTKEMFEEITKWQADTFKQATALSAAKHLKKETGELVEAIETYATGKAIDHEYADVILLVFGSMKLYGYSYEEICKIINEKFEIIQKREWGKVNDEGFVEHVRQSPVPSEGTLVSEESLIAIIKTAFYNGYDKCDKDDANCFTGWREEAARIIHECKNLLPDTAALSEYRSTEGWTRVEDGLPEVGEFVMVYNTEGAILTGRLMSNGWVASFLDGEKLMGELTATHWQPLPAPPHSDK